MDADNALIIGMLILAFVGLLGAITYYVARYTFRTDHEADREIGREIGREKGKLEQKTTTHKEAEHILAKPPAVEYVEADVKQALSKTKESISGRIRNLFGSQAGLGRADMEALEEILYTSDLGPQTVERLMEAVQDKLNRSESQSLDRVREAIREEIHKIFANTPSPLSSATLEAWLEKVDKTEGPHVILVVGVNGAGKTTTIGKLAHWFASNNRPTLVAAGDTFRAAAGDQLKVWSERAKVEIFSPEGVSDPSAVAFDACQKAKSKDFKVVIIDTAGRLHTQKNLMEELAKMKRVIKKVFPDGPEETLLVLDSNSGQNALMQARQFNEALEVTGVVLTKLDGTAKGGVAIGITNELHIPIQLIGIGEGISDLRPFNSKEYIDSII